MATYLTVNHRGVITHKNIAQALPYAWASEGCVVIYYVDDKHPELPGRWNITSVVDEWVR